MNNDYTNPSTMSNNTWSSTGQSTNPSQTNSNNNQSQPTSSATSTFNNYTINTKWGSHNSSQSSTPTNPSTLTATFPSLSSGIPPLYPSISAQSSNSVNQQGAPSPFAHHTGIPPHQNIANTPTNQTSAYAFNAAQTLNKVASNNNNNNNNNTNTNTTNNSSNPSLNASNTNSNNQSNNNSRPSTAGGHGGGISQSSSSSSLTGLSGGISKLQINTNALGSYNPYSTGSGFTPYAGGHTPTGNNSAANTPNPGNGATPTGFRFSGYPNPYSQIATPPTPANGLLGGAMGGPGGPFAQARFNSNTLHQQAIQNNLQQAMGLNYRIGKLPTLSANNSLTGLPNLSNPPSMNNPGLTQQTSNNTNTNSNGLPTPANNTSNDKKMNLNSNAAPYQPRTNANAPPSTLINPLANNDNMKTQQLAHQQKAENVPYSYPSYAEAVNKVNTLNIANINNQLQAQLQQAQMQQQQQKQKSLQSNDKENDNDSNTENTKLASESEEAIQKLNPISWPSNPKHAKFYVIKSFGEDDVHKSIKYNLWCSTERGNRKLDEAFNESKRINAANNNQPLDDNIGKASGQQRKGKNKKDKDKDQNLVDPRDTVKGCPVYLFFSVNRSGCFCGMAQMISNYYKDRHFGSWVQDGKWQGSFIVKWIYVKDIPNKDLKDIQLPNNDNRPVTFSRDTQEIPFNQGIEMLRRFIKYEPKTNILQDFKYYDDRERDIKQKRTQQMIMQQLQQQQMGPMSNLGSMQNSPFGNNNNQNQGNNNNRSSNNMNSYNNNNKFGNNNNNMQDIRNGPYKRGRYNSGYNNNNENYNNNYGGNNNSQIEGYNNSHRGGGGRGGYKGYNSRRYNNGYNNNRRYHSKNDRNNSYHNNSYRGGGRGGYRNNNYSRNNNNNNNNDSNYGNIQILSKERGKNNYKSTPGNSDRNSNNGLDDMDDNNQQSSPSRGSRNRNRNRWVPK